MGLEQTDTYTDHGFWTLADKAYDHAVDRPRKPGQGSILAESLSAHHYYYVQLLGESAGAKLIDEAAKTLAAKTRFKKEQPFIHLTFLDAYTRTAKDSGKEGYGHLAGYPEDKQYAEHYVDNSIVRIAADACLLSAFNFNISNWFHFEWEGGLLFPGHQWPRNWYRKSITSTSPKFQYGYTLSLAGSGRDINELDSERATYPAGEQCELRTIPLIYESPHCQPSACEQ